MTRDERLAYFNELVTPNTRLMDIFDRTVDLCGDNIFIKEYETNNTITWNQMRKATDLLAKGLIAVSYTHLDVYKRQEMYYGKA